MLSFGYMSREEALKQGNNESLYKITNFVSFYERSVRDRGGKKERERGDIIVSKFLSSVQRHF